MMSDSSSVCSDVSATWVDDIEECRLEFEGILMAINNALTQLYEIRRKLEGPMITYEGETKAVVAWLTEWEGEMAGDKYHNITWGQFLLEKLEKATDAEHA